ncbi:MAG: alpha/beta hydrolase [Thermofilum sp.]
MTIDPEVRRFLDYFYKNFNIYQINDIKKFRDTMNDLLGKFMLKEPVYKIEDLKINSEGAEIPIRIYYPDNNKDHPIIMYFHGGAWILGSIETEDPIARILTNACNCIVVSVDYRLAPEYKFPTAVYDCFNATVWSLNNKLGNGKIGVAGISAGGNLAAAVSLLARDKGLKLASSALIVPFVYPDLASKSVMEYKKGYFLDINVPIDPAIIAYIRDLNDLHNPLFAPLVAQDLSGLPPTIVVTAEYDPLRDQGEAYASRLMESGVQTLSIRINGHIHALLGSPRVARQVAVMVGTLLRDIMI